MRMDEHLDNREEYLWKVIPSIRLMIPVKMITYEIIDEDEN
jgi:hypothetical protein